MLLHNRIVRMLLSGLFCAVIALSSAVPASAASCEFSLSDAQAQKGRLFELTLECCAEDEISAFIADISFNPDVMEYRSALLLGENAQYSVNSAEKGKLTAVYLCEDGTVCRKETALLKLTFKALQEGTSQVTLDVRQVIDADSSDITVSTLKGAQVYVTALTANSAKPESSQTVERDTASEGNTESTVKITTVEGNPYDPILILTLILTVVILLCAAVLCAYKLGAKSAAKRKEKDLPRDFDRSAAKSKK